jgi:hypothetical protein
MTPYVRQNHRFDRGHQPERPFRRLHYPLQLKEWDSLLFCKLLLHPIFTSFHLIIHLPVQRRFFHFLAPYPRPYAQEH